MVEAVGRLIQEEQFGPRRQGQARKRQPLLALAQGTVSLRGRQRVLHVKEFAGRAVEGGAGAGLEGHHLAERCLAGRFDALDDHGQAPGGLGGWVSGRRAEDLGRAFRRLDQARQEPEERRLARAVGAEQGDDPPPRHLEREAVEGPGVTVQSRQALGV